MKAKVITKRVALVVVTALFLLWLNPFYRCLPEPALRRLILLKTPIGATTASVLQRVQRKWSKRNITIAYTPGLARGPAGYTIPVGAKSIGPLDSGSYFTLVPGLPMVTHVYVTWAFDDKDKLIEVLVQKEIDAP